MRWLPCSILLAALAAGLAVRTLAAGNEDPLVREEKASAALLQADSRLQAKLTVAYKGQPLRTVVADLSKRLKVTLAVTPDTADDRIVAFLDDRPASEVLRLISEQLSFRWTKQGAGFRLEQSEFSRRHEQRLREDERDTQWAACIARIQRVNQLLSRPAEQLQARKAEVALRLMNKDLPPEERTALATENAELYDATFPSAAAGTRIFGSLSPAEVEGVRRGGMIRRSTFDNTLPAPLVDEIARAVGTRGGVAPADPKQAQADLIVLFSEERDAQTRPELTYLHRYSFQVHIPYGTARSYFPMSWTINPSPFPGDPPAGDTPTEDPDLKRTLEFPKEWAASAPYSRNVPWRQDLPTVADLAEALHKNAGLEVVSDSYIRSRINPMALAGQVPAIRVLDQITRQLHYTWKKEGKLVRLRDDEFFRDRPAEVPERVLAAWKKDLGAGGMPNLDQLASLAGSVTDVQAAGLYEYWGWYFEKAPYGTAGLGGSFRSTLQDLRLWARLLPAQRQSALAGEELPVARMTATQQGAVLAALLPRPGSNPGPMHAAPIRSADQVAAVRFSLGRTEKRYQEVRITRGNTSISNAVPLNPDGSLPQNYFGSGPDAERVGKPYTDNLLTFKYQLPNMEQPLRSRTLLIPKPESETKPPGG